MEELLPRLSDEVRIDFLGTVHEQDRSDQLHMATKLAYWQYEATLDIGDVTFVSEHSLGNPGRIRRSASIDSRNSAYSSVSRELGSWELVPRRISRRISAVKQVVTFDVA